MTNPTIIQEETMCLVDVKEAVSAMEKRDTELGLLAQKAKEYLDSFVQISRKDRTALEEGLKGLKLTRLKPEHIAKIIDFLPQTDDELKSVLQAYPLTLPKKDKEAIIAEVKKIA